MSKHNHAYAITVSLFVALGGFLLGFDGVVNGGAVPFYRITLGISDQPFLIGLSSSAIILGAMIGNFCVAFLIDRIGRKPTLMITSFLFMIGAAGTALVPNIGLFILAKMVAGLGVGIAILVAPMYIAEIAPPKHRGWLVTFNQLNIVVGLSIAMLTNYYILNTISDPDLNWRWMLGIGFFPAALYFILLLFVPESPRWLIQKGRRTEGLKILKKSCGQTEGEKEYQSIEESLKEGLAKGEGSIKEVFSKSMRYILFVGIGLAIFQQLSGINAVLYYAPMIFETTGSGMDAAFLMAIVVGIVFTMATIVSMFLIDRLGRRPLLIMGCAIMAASFFLVSYAFKESSYRLNDAQIASVYNQAIQAEISNQAKISFPDNYITDSIQTIGQGAHLYKAGELIGIIEMSRPAIQEAIRHAEALRNVMQDMKGKTYQKETAFFGLIKSQLTSKFQGEESVWVGKTFSQLYKSAILKAAIAIDGRMVLLGILGFITGFSISLGPVMWAMFSEIFPGRIRAKAISVVGATNGLTSFLVATIFPVQLEWIGSANTYFLFGLFMFLCLGFVFKYVPETKGKTLEELELELVNA